MENIATSAVAYFRRETKRLLRAQSAAGMRVQTFSIIRWVGMAGQLFTVLLVYFSLGISLPIIPLILAIAIIPLPNLWLWWRDETDRIMRGTTALALFLFDVAQIGLVLGLSGGLDNPFCLMILLPVALAATTLDRASILVVTAWAIAVITFIAYFKLPLPWPDGPVSLPKLYTAATWTALCLALTLIAGYVWQLARESRKQADAFAATQLALAREQQLAALGAQAAAVAHHLGSPLATVNVIAKELARETPDDHPLAAEIGDLLNESRRCREILATLGRSPSVDDHDRFIAKPLSVVIDEICSPYRQDGVEIRVKSIVDAGTSEPIVKMAPERRHALSNLVENAASFANALVHVIIRSNREYVVVTIQDDGPGFPPEVMDRIGEPYISTRSSSGGLGLGLYIAHSLLARTGAKLHFGNTTTGAQIRIQWPREALAAGLETGDG